MKIEFESDREVEIFLDGLFEHRCDKYSYAREKIKEKGYIKQSELEEARENFLRLFDNITFLSTEKETFKCFKERAMNYIKQFEKEIERLKNQPRG